MAGDFDALEVYHQARELGKWVFGFIRQLPGDERLGLEPEMRRTAVSMVQQILKGQGGRHPDERMVYGFRARGSVNKLLAAIGTCEDRGYGEPERLEAMREQARVVIRLIDEAIAVEHARLAQRDKQARGRKN